MPSALREHWPEYAIEAFLFGTFMLVAAVATALMEALGSFLHHALPDAFSRRVVIGAAMGLTAAALIYSPWGRRSGAHMNPAITLAGGSRRRSDCTAPSLRSATQPTTRIAFRP